MQVEIKRPRDLTAAEAGAWRAMRASAPSLASPYFSLAFAQAVDAVRGDTRVAVLRRRGEIAGFLPFQSDPFGFARALGGPLSDSHGFVAPDGADLPVAEILARGRLGVFAFTHAPAAQRALARYAVRRDGCHVIDLSGGFRPWLDERRALKANLFSQLPRKRRKLAREQGDIVVTIDDPSPEAFERLITWKRQQYRRSGYFDVFSVGWTRSLLESLWRRPPDDELRALLTTFTVGGRLMAAHFGMISGPVWHYWFPAYDVDAAAASPGNLLLLDMAEAAAGLGVTAIHLGPGEDRYKEEFGVYEIPLAAGFASAPSVAAIALKLADAIERGFERLPYRPVARLPGRIFRRVDMIAGFHVTIPALIDRPLSGR